MLLYKQEKHAKPETTTAFMKEAGCKLVSQVYHNYAQSFEQGWKRGFSKSRQIPPGE